MDIPIIKFKYFEKLKLYHDYLDPKSVFEKEKMKYWQHEKMILLWAYSDIHQHLYTALDNKRIFEIYGIEDEKESEFKKLNVLNLNINDIVKDLKKDKGKVNYIKGNLVLKEFAEATKEGNPEKYPERIRINRKGLLLGEMLYEVYCNPTFLRINFRKYKIGIWFIIILLLII